MFVTVSPRARHGTPMLPIPRWRRGAGLAALTGCVAALATSPVAFGATTTVGPEADAHTLASSPSSNFGSSSSLKVDADALAVGYLRFRPANLDGAVVKATLRVFTSSSSATGFQVRPVASTAWGENTITHANRPAVGTTVLAKSGPFASKTYVSVDVTPAVAGNGPVSLALTTTTATSFLVAARESGSIREAKLIVETSGTAPAPSPTPEPTPEPDPTPAPTPAPSGGDFLRRPYSDSSPWNTKIGSNPAVATDLQTGIGLIGGPITSDPSQYTYPVYIVDSSTPVGKVKLSGLYSNVTGTGSEDTTLTRVSAPVVEVPLRPEFSPAVGSDGQAIIVNPQTGDEWGFWRLAKDATGAWTATNGYHYNVYWDGHPPRSSSGSAFGSRGAGVTYFSGLVRPYEIASGRIDHALAFAFGGSSTIINQWPSTSWVYPAAKSDGRSTDPNSLPEGARLQLDPAITELELRARGCSQAAITIAHAMQEYGMYVIDQSGSDKIILEYNGTADWSSLGVGRSTASCIPLDRMRVVR